MESEPILDIFKSLFFLSRPSSSPTDSEKVKSASDAVYGQRFIDPMQNRFLRNRIFAHSRNLFAQNRSLRAFTWLESETCLES